MDINTYRDIAKEFADDTTDDIGMVSNQNNVVSGATLRNIQAKTLKQTSEFLSKTFGPMGSNTKIITGNDKASIDSSYSKDGLKVLHNISNSGPIEASIVQELIDITSHVEHEVGDGTTSTVILSSLIFDKLRVIEKENKLPPYALMREFNTVVDDIKEVILSNKQEVTIDSIKNIALISTNGNEEVAENISSIYRDYGFDVDLNVGISNNENSILKVYDGFTITEGMADPVYINNKKDNTSEIHNAKIYHFADPIDDMYTIQLFETIINDNIYKALEENKPFVPTVITCPRLSQDMSGILRQLSNQLYQFDSASASEQKPPVLIITNVVASDEIIMDDIANLCGCKSITKYIDPDLYAADKEKGIAPTVNNIHEFAGYAELVVADSKKTKFINPEHGKDESDPKYKAMVNFLETELTAQLSGDKDPNHIGLLKKRLSALKANMVDYLVGGITISDRENIRDLVEDAVKNCKSAAKYGVGYAANFEGLKAACTILNSDKYNDNDIKKDIVKAIFLAYCGISKILYNTVDTAEAAISAVFRSIDIAHPFNIKTGIIELAETAAPVLCSIMLDINILSTISKIIGRMVTCNQCLLQSPNINTY